MSEVIDESKLNIICFADSVGRIKINEKALSWEQLEAKYPGLGEGGSYHPPDCASRHKVAVIVPYRNRDHHLRVFLNHYHPLLQRQQIEYAIYVIDQVS